MDTDNLPFLRFTFSFIQALVKLPATLVEEIIEAIKEAFAEGRSEGFDAGHLDGWKAGYRAVLADALLIPMQAQKNTLEELLAQHLEDAHTAVENLAVNSRLWVKLNRDEPNAIAKYLASTVALTTAQAEAVVAAYLDVYPSEREVYRRLGYNAGHADGFQRGCEAAKLEPK